MKNEREPTQEVSISVVIPAHEEGDWIVDYSLQSIAEQDFPKEGIETIVVANACTDRTVEMATSYIRNELEGRGVVIETDKRGVSHAKNLGSEEATGGIVAYLDADTRAATNLLSKVAESVEEGYHTGKTLVYPDIETPLGNLYWGWVRACSRLSEKRSKSNGSGGFLFASKFALDRLLREGKEDFIFDPARETMEDVNFQDRIKKFGKFKLIQDSGVTTSTRRYEEPWAYPYWFFRDHWEVLFPKGKKREVYR